MKKVLYVILGLLGVYLILCLIGKSESKVERSIVINAPIDAVKAAIVDHKVFHDHWSPWTEKDPNGKIVYEGEAGQPGHKMSWDSEVKEVGKGSMTFNGFNGDSIIETLHFDDYGDSKVYHIVKAEGNGVSVTWGMHSKMPFFFRAMGLFMDMDAMIGPDYEKGLANLKKYVESTPATPAAANYDVQEIDFPETNLIGTKKNRLTMDKVESFFGDNYKKIAEDLAKNKIEPISMPSALYIDFKMEDMSADVVACFKVAKGAKVKGLENYDFPAGKAVFLAYRGGYNDMMAAHDAIKKFMTEKNLSSNVTYEEYVTDPGTEKDTTKWLTNIYYIITPAK